MKFKPSLGNMIIVAVILGIVAGVFFGEDCAKLGVIGNAFIALLQMCVLPYILFSMIHGIGSLSYKEARMLAVKGGVLMLIFWGIAFIFILLMPVCFPEWKSAAFFSTSTVAPAEEMDYLGLYIPSNPFNSLANNMVPAVTIFSIFIGVALIGIEKKEPLLDNLNILCKALSKVTNMMVKLTPIGTFAITANAAGTMTLEEFGRIQVYFVGFIGAALMLSFCVLPVLVSLVTPFKYRDILNVSKDAVLTALTTGNLFIILPIISQNSRMLFEKYHIKMSESDSTSDIIIPIIYNFPNIGKLLGLLFILFAAWFSGTTIGFMQYPDFIVSGLLSFFGSSNVAVPFLLKHFQIPGDLFEIYLVSGIINGKFSTMLAAINLFAFTLICICWLTQKLEFSVKKFVGYGGTMIVLVAAIIIGAKIILAKVITQTNDHEQQLASMTVPNPVKFVVSRKMPDASLFKKLFEPSASGHLERIKKRKVLRVGYNINAMPFSFFNKKGELVGYDIDMANQLAKELGCHTVKFFPLKYDNINLGLKNNFIDIAMAGISINGERIQQMDFTAPYMRLNLGLVMKDYMRDDFKSIQDMRKIPDLTVAVLKGSVYKARFKTSASKVKCIEIKSFKDFFDGKTKADVLLTSAEQGAAWTILYPSYTVVIPKPKIYKDLIAYAISKGDQEFLNFLNYWLELKEDSGVTQKMYRYWVLGKDVKKKKPRWSILHNVLKVNSKAE
jgi:Na+/H+-dicarboxylate symporter